jgi:hypothetical protein
MTSIFGFDNQQLIPVIQDDDAMRIGNAMAIYGYSTLLDSTTSRRE